MNALPSAFVVELAFKSTAVLACAFASMAFARRLAAEERHVVWAVALACLLVMPVLSVSGPQLRVPGERAIASAVASLWTGAHSDSQGASADGARRAPNPEAGRGARTGGAGRAGAAGPSGTDLARGVSAARTAIYGAAGARRLAVAAGTAYLAVAAALLAYFAAAAARVAVSLRRLEPLTDPRALAALEHARATQRVRRRVRLKVSDVDATPWAWGVVRPVVVVPRDFAALPAAAQRDALLHELAHVARLDFVTMLLGCAVCSLYWFQPLAWLALRRMARESEQACDDRVLLAGGANASYAEQLLETARAIRSAGRMHRPAAASAMARSSAVARRIASILDPNTRRRAMGKKYVCLVSILTAAVLLPVASLKSQEAAAPAGETPAVPADPNDAAFLALVQRGPANDEELKLIVETFIANGRQADAVGVLADFISRDVPTPAQAAFWALRAPGCGYCSDILGAQGTLGGTSSAATKEELEALSAAFDEVEARARKANDGDLLIRLATIAEASRNANAIGKGTYYLIEGFRLGGLSEASNFSAIWFLSSRGWDGQAKELAQHLYDDSSSSLYQSEAVKRAIDSLNAKIGQRDDIVKRVLNPNATITYKDDKDVIPLYRVPPVYPPVALKEHREGYVQLKFTITAEGKTKDVTAVSSSDDAFDASAVEAVSHWLYAPKIVDGAGVERPGVQSIIRFVLEQ
ncbi:MAG TPA: M56 family metallopeptidase [Gammaproteobacteria bacterium]|nr:M56 family metallopeptidase [Gammaproteobacteria bacterium]